MITLPSNAAPPTTITVVIKSPLWGPDLTTVSAVTFLVRRRDGTNVTWTATIAAATAQELVAQYGIQVGDLTSTGAYQLAPQLAVQGGTVPCFSVNLFVASPWDDQPKLTDEVWVAANVKIGPDSYGTRNTWVPVVGSGTPFQAISLQPWIAADLRNGQALNLDLWSAGDGDVVAVTDVFGKCSPTMPINLFAAAGQSVPTTVGNYGASCQLTAPGVYIRMKFSVGLGNIWVPTW